MKKRICCAEIWEEAGKELKAGKVDQGMETLFIGLCLNCVTELAQWIMSQSVPASDDNPNITK